MKNKKLKKKIKELQIRLIDHAKINRITLDKLNNAIEVLAKSLNIPYDVELDGIYVNDINCSRELFKNGEVEKLLKKELPSNAISVDCSTISSLNTVVSTGALKFTGNEQISLTNSDN